MINTRVVGVGMLCAVFIGSVSAQALLPKATSAAPASVPSGDLGKSCNPFDIRLSAELTFRQRACFYEQRLTARSTVMRAVFSSAWGDFRNNPHSENDGSSEFIHRFGVFYAQRSARFSGELIAGYLNREDPRPQRSLESGIWNRTRAALLSVVEVKDADGQARPAFAPIAGAFGSGMVGVACYRTHNSVEDGFLRSAIAYGGYFGTALMHEFQPELAGLRTKLLHKR